MTDVWFQTVLMTHSLIVTQDLNKLLKFLKALFGHSQTNIRFASIKLIHKDIETILQSRMKITAEITTFYDHGNFHFVRESQCV